MESEKNILNIYNCNLFTSFQLDKIENQLDESTFKNMILYIIEEENLVGGKISLIQYFMKKMCVFVDVKDNSIRIKFEKKLVGKYASLKDMSTTINYDFSVNNEVLYELLMEGFDSAWSLLYDMLHKKKVSYTEREFIRKYKHMYDDGRLGDYFVSMNDYPDGLCLFTWQQIVNNVWYEDCFDFKKDVLKRLFKSFELELIIANFQEEIDKNK